MTNHPTDRRQAIIDGLRELADALAEHPELPMPKYPGFTIYPEGSDEEARAEVDRLAAVLGVTPTKSRRGTHYWADRKFGAIEYRVLAIADEDMKRHAAQTSYTDNVQVDAEAVTA